MKKLMKKALPIIMSAMLITSVTAVGASAVEVTVKKTAVASEKATVNTYVDEKTGVKLESSDIALTSENVSVTMDLELNDVLGMFEEAYAVGVFTDDGELLDYEKYPVTLYLPCEKDDCNIIADLGSERGDEFVPLDFEYVDGYYKMDMTDWGDFYICDFTWTENYSKLEQQTLVDEKTGISVSGVIETDSRLLAYDAKDMYKEVVEKEGERYVSNIVAMSQDFEGYGVFLKRNFEDAHTEGDLTITLPTISEGYEIRCFNYIMDMSDEDSDEAESLGFGLYTTLDPAEELAERLTAFVDKVYPPLEAEYIDGKYVIKSDYVGYFYIAPAGSFTVTVDDINKIRKDEGILEEDVTMPTEAPTQTSTQAPTQASTQASAQTTTQSQQTATQATTATQSNGTVKTSDSGDIAVLLVVLSTITLATAFVLRKRFKKS